jgi:ABC-type multidrug transport system ATPase subunit
VASIENPLAPITAFMPDLTVVETLKLYAALYPPSPWLRGTGPKPDSTGIHSVLQRVDLVDKAGAMVRGLSGGQKQRLALAMAMQHDPDLYILDEPTTGLHFEDVRRLLEVLGKLVDQGNTIVVIEHNLDVIKTADWVIDLGPEGGAGGGAVVAAGSPEAVARSAESATGRFLAPALGLASARAVS